jgi:hypothetical protein
LTAKFEHEVGGTAVYCSFALHPFVTGFLIFWVGFVVLIGGAVGVQSLQELSHPSPPDNVWMGILIPFFMVLFAAVLTCVGWSLSSSDKDFLIGLISRAIEARPDRIQLEA